MRRAAGWTPLLHRWLSIGFSERPGGDLCGSPGRFLSSGKHGFPQHKRSDETDAEKAHNLDQHVCGSVNTGETIPVPVQNVGRDRGQDSGDEDESNAAGESADPGLREQKDHKDGFG